MLLRAQEVAWKRDWLCSEQGRDWHPQTSEFQPLCPLVMVAAALPPIHHSCLQRDRKRIHLWLTQPQVAVFRCCQDLLVEVPYSLESGAPRMKDRRHCLSQEEREGAWRASRRSWG